VGHAQLQSASSAADFRQLREEYAAVQMELAELKSVALIAESANREEMSGLKERFSQETASMEQAMRGKGAFLHPWQEG
jgi:hypothetical protein